jgi:hypothetical protein
MGAEIAGVFNAIVTSRRIAERGSRKRSFAPLKDAKSRSATVSAGPVAATSPTKRGETTGLVDPIKLLRLVPLRAEHSRAPGAYRESNGSKNHHVLCESMSPKERGPSPAAQRWNVVSTMPARTLSAHQPSLLASRPSRATFLRPGTGALRARLPFVLSYS